MSAEWVTILGLCVTTALIKATGPVLFGGRQLPSAMLSVIALVAPALLAALVVVQTFTDPSGDLTLDARAGGLAAAAMVLWRRPAGLLEAVLAAAATAALIRLVA